MNLTLKPCPFCGGTDISLGEIMSKDIETGEYYSQSECQNCGAASPKNHVEGLISHEIEERNAEIWNKRT